jgi:hypothetical protein
MYPRNGVLVSLAKKGTSYYSHEDNSIDLFLMPTTMCLTCGVSIFELLVLGGDAHICRKFVEIWL